MTEEWKHYGAAGGWTLKLLRGTRNLFFLSPQEGYFRLAFVFGDRAVAAIERSDLPAKMVEELRLARKYAEGRALRMEVRQPADLELVKKLVAVKIDNWRPGRDPPEEGIGAPS